MRADNRASSEQVSVQLGREIRRLREERGYTREALVERMGGEIVSRSLVAYEHGARQLSVPRLLEVCEVLDVSPPAVLKIAMERANAVKYCLRCGGLPCPACGVSR